MKKAKIFFSGILLSLVLISCNFPTNSNTSKSTGTDTGSNTDTSTETDTPYKTIPTLTLPSIDDTNFESVNSVTLSDGIWKYLSCGTTSYTDSTSGCTITTTSLSTIIYTVTENTKTFTSGTTEISGKIQGTSEQLQEYKTKNTSLINHYKSTGIFNEDGTYYYKNTISNMLPNTSPNILTISTSTISGTTTSVSLKKNTTETIIKQTLTSTSSTGTSISYAYYIKDTSSSTNVQIPTLTPPSIDDSNFESINSVTLSNGNWKLQQYTTSSSTDTSSGCTITTTTLATMIFSVTGTTRNVTSYIQEVSGKIQGTSEQLQTYKTNNASLITYYKTTGIFNDDGTCYYKKTYTDSELTNLSSLPNTLYATSSGAITSTLKKNTAETTIKQTITTTSTAGTSTSYGYYIKDTTSSSNKAIPTLTVPCDESEFTENVTTLSSIPGGDWNLISLRNTNNYAITSIAGCTVSITTKETISFYYNGLMSSNPTINSKTMEVVGKVEGSAEQIQAYKKSIISTINEKGFFNDDGSYYYKEVTSSESELSQVTVTTAFVPNPQVTVKRNAQNTKYLVITTMPYSDGSTYKSYQYYIKQ